MPALFDVPGSPSAIDEMMRSLLSPPQVQQTPQAGLLGGPTPAAMSSQMPQVAAPPMTAPRQSMVDRIQSRMSGLLDSIRPSAPAGYAGLLSEEEIKGARPSLLQSLIGSPDAPSSSDRYRRNLDGILGMKEYAAKLAEGRGKAALEQKHAALREQVGAALGDTTMASEARFAALTKLLGVAYANGDMQSMGAISSAMQTAKPTVTAERNPVVGSPAWKEAEAYKASLRPAGGGSADRVMVQIQQPDGTVVYAPRSEAAGQMAPGTKGSKATEGETAYGMFAARMASVAPLLAKFEARGKPGYVQEGARKIPLFGDDIANTVSSEDQQLYRQAQEDWVRAKLRKESGAAIGDKEMESEIRLYFPKPGDKQSVVEQKASRRTEAETLMRQAAGRGSAPFTTPKGSGSESGTKKKSSLDDYRHLLK